MKKTKQDFVKYRLKKADETFRDAQLLTDNKRNNSAVNRLYYACFYAVNALLISNDIQAQTHNGVKIQFFREYIKTGILSQESGKLYSDLFDWRQEADYSDFIDFDEETLTGLLTEVKVFLNSIKSLVDPF